MKSGQAVDERVAITRGRRSPLRLARPPSHRRPILRRAGDDYLYDDPYLEFTLPTQVEGAGGGGHRQRTCAGLDQEPYDLVSLSSSLN